MHPPAADWRLAILPRAPAAEAANAEGSLKTRGSGVPAVHRGFVACQV